MATETAATDLPILKHLHTLHHPSGTTRSWSSRPHPSHRTPLLVTASSDRSVQIWNLRDFKLVSTIAGGHKRSVRCVGWKDWGVSSAARNSGDDEDGNETSQPANAEKPVTLATGSFDANTGIWVYEPQDSKGGAMSAIDELDMTNPPDEDGGDGEEEDWHFTTLLTGPDSEVKDLQFCPPWYGANLLATCSRDKSVWVWEEVDSDNEWETIAVLGEHTGDVKCVGWCTGAKARVGGADVTVGCREILASGSYDDTIRLWKDVEEEGDWVCVGVVTGHGGTVWDLCWEGYLDRKLWKEDVDVREWEGRIISCSDDLTVRLWKRELSESEREKKREKLRNGAVDGPKQDRLPSIIRPQTTMEKWTEVARLPEAHVRSIYAVDWSRRTGLVVTCGGDGAIVTYREVPDTSTDTDMNGADRGAQDDDGRKKTKWVITAVVEAAHDEYEINHVCWSLRRDKDKRWEGEEMIVSTGDDGTVRVWTLPEEMIDKDWKTN